MKIETQHLDKLNIGLILLSLGLAWWIPFELFVFSYAILGPLHYLTEIHWLRKKDYFLDEPSGIRWFFGLTLLIVIPVILSVPGFQFLWKSKTLFALVSQLSHYSRPLIVVGLVLAVCLVLFRRLSASAGVLSLGLVFVYVAMKWLPGPFLMVAAFIPTLIHVYLFTLFFMVFGALRSRSRPGWVSIGVLVLVPVSVVFLPVSVENPGASSSLQTMFSSIGLAGFSEKMVSYFSTQNALSAEVLLRFQIFIAFAYTYHYLNWFSKTSVIGWNKNNSLVQNGLIGLAWVGSVALYFIENQLGVALLFSLSMLHVMMELPLNARSARDTVLAIGQWRSRF